MLEKTYNDVAVTFFLRNFEQVLRNMVVVHSDLQYGSPPYKHDKSFEK